MEESSRGLHRAMFFSKQRGKKVLCNLCHRNCVIEQEKRGYCGVRKNVNGELYSLVYGRTLTTQIDPIEKKPFFHFKPGSQCLSISTFGCNFSCLHCQNFAQSQMRIEKQILAVPITSPEMIVEKALEAGVEGISYTYNEPAIFAEYALDIMRLAKQKGLSNTWVSNGYMTKECIDAIVPFLDAINIDFKGTEKFYKEVCGNAELKFVKENIKAFFEKKTHLEITYLIIPGQNDKERDFRVASEFLAAISPKIPLHFSRFFPTYKMEHLPATGIEKMELAEKTAKESGLKFVFLGNLKAEENTVCPECGSLLVKRMFFSAEKKGLDEKGNCANCGFETGIIL